MSPTSRRPVALALGAVLIAVLLGGCGASAATFSPSGPCLADGRARGAYPQLERLVPVSLFDTSPTTVDSGRSCSTSALGTLVTHRVTDLRFAGATWDRGGGNGETTAVLALPDRDLPVAWAEEFYEAGARAARNTDRIETSRPTVNGRSVFRLDTLNGLSYQSVVVWQDGARVRVALAAVQLGSAVSKATQDAFVVEFAGKAMSQGDALDRRASPSPSGPSTSSAPGASPSSGAGASGS